MTCECALSSATTECEHSFTTHPVQVVSNPTLGNGPLSLRSETCQTSEGCNVFSHLLPVFRRTAAVYSDRSFFHESAGSTFIYGNRAVSYCLHNFNSVFTAKLYAHTELFCLSSAAYHLNCTGSLSSLQTVTNYSPDNPIVNETCIQLPHLQKSGKSVLFCRVPGWQRGH